MIAPAKTGRESNNSTAVTKTDQTNSGVAERVIPGCRMFIIVVIKLIAPRILLAPARCKEKMVRSTDALA